MWTKLQKKELKEDYYKPKIIINKTMKKNKNYIDDIKKLFKIMQKDVAMCNHLSDSYLEDLIKIYNQVERRKVEELEKKYKDIFLWLSGENGDFSDLSQKPHYSFRTELRERLKSLSTKQNQNE